MNTHRKDGFGRHALLSGMNAAVCVSLPNRGGIPTYLMPHADAVSHVFGITPHGT